MRVMRRGLTLLEVIVVLAVIALLIALLLPAVRSARETGRGNQCQNDMKQLAIAQHTYHEMHGHFPAAYTEDSEGNQLHGWRTAILPFIEEAALSEKIELDHSWESEKNKEVRYTTLEAYLCPSGPDVEGIPRTDYVAVVGSETVFPGTSSRKFKEIIDGTAQTLLLTEHCVNEQRGERPIPWFSPGDLADWQYTAMGDQDKVMTHHPNVVLTSFADGHVQALDATIDATVRQALITIAGGEADPLVE